MRKILLAALLALPGLGQAQVLGVHVGSHHVGGGYCNENPGIYYRAESGLTLGAYRNSECRRWSAYAGHTWGDHIALTVGAVTGYERASVLPLVVPSVRFGPARVAVLPPVGGMPTVIHLMLEKRF